MSAYREQSAVRASFDLGAEDVASAAARLKRRGRFAHPVAVTFGVFVGAGLIELLILGGSAGQRTLALLAAAGAWFAWMLHKQVRAGEKTGGDRLAAHGRFLFTADDDGVVVETDRVQWSLAWRHIAHWDETAESFLVFLDAARYQIVPKRGFEASGETALRQMLTDRAKKDPETVGSRHLRAWGPWLVLIVWVASLLCSIAEVVGR